MLMRRCAVLFCIFCLQVSTAGYVRAETVQLSKMDRPTEVYIQRGNIHQNVNCYASILQDFTKRKIRKSEIYVTYDDPQIDGIGIGLADADENYTCENGELRVWETGEYQVLKKFR